MKRILAASFFVTYVVVLGLWPTSRWWMHPNIMTWTMYSRGVGDAADTTAIEASFNDGRRLVLPIAKFKPFYYLYPPGTSIPPRNALQQNALFRFTERIRVPDRLANQICIALPDARVIHYSESDAEETAFPCQR